MTNPYNSSPIRIMEFKILSQNTSSFLGQVEGICQKYSCQYTWKIIPSDEYNQIIIDFGEIKTTICDGYFRMLEEIYFCVI